MTLLFGQQEDITCIADVAIVGQHDEPLCLAYKTSTYHVAAGVYFHDDGYVLKPKMGSDNLYYPLTGADIEHYQSESLLPAPLPAYQIPLYAYAWGYFLWIAIALTTAWGVGKQKLKARRLERVTRQRAA